MIDHTLREKKAFEGLAEVALARDAHPIVRRAMVDLSRSIVSVLGCSEARVEEARAGLQKSCYKLETAVSKHLFGKPQLAARRALTHFKDDFRYGHMMRLRNICGGIGSHASKICTDHDPPA